MSLQTVRMTKVSTRRGPSAGDSMAATNEARNGRYSRAKTPAVTSLT
jgi:hypothetical protein